MNQLEYTIDLIDKVIPIMMEQDNISRDEAVTLFLNWIHGSFLTGQNDVDALDFMIAFILCNKIWDASSNAKLVQEISNSPLFEEVSKFLMGFAGAASPEDDHAVGPAKEYYDLYYKTGQEDTVTFLWRCLCLGCFPDEDFLRLSEEEKRNDRKDIRWIVFDDIFETYLEGEGDCISNLPNEIRYEKPANRA